LKEKYLEGWKFGRIIKKQVECISYPDL